jgi:hypothetical protein
LENSDDFIFDNQMLAQAIFYDFKGGEVSCPTRYFPEASSINLIRSVKYGVGVLLTSMNFVLQKRGWYSFRIFSPAGHGLLFQSYYLDSSNISD